MMEITMKQILSSNGLDTALLNNPRVTKALAQKLLERGFRKVQRTVNGERVNVWTTEETLMNFDAGLLVDTALNRVQA